MILKGLGLTIDSLIILLNDSSFIFVVRKHYIFNCTIITRLGCFISSYSLYVRHVS